MRSCFFFLLTGLAAMGQETSSDPSQVTPTPAQQTEGAPRKFVIDPGTKIPLSLINSVSTKNATAGDRVYLESVFPIMAGGKIVIPPGSYVAGTITEVKRPGRIKGRGELFLRFDSLTLPNGVTRDFKARIGSLDGRANEVLDKQEGKIKSEGNKGGDLATIAGTAATGASVGALGGGLNGRPGMGAGIGAAAGAAAGLMGVMLTRGPEAMLTKGTTLEMVLDRTLAFDADEIAFGPEAMRRPASDGSGPMPSKKNSDGGLRRRFPL